MERATQDSFNTTYRGLLDTLNEKKKAGLKYDFAAELKVFERDHELDTLAFFRVRAPRSPPEALVDVRRSGAPVSCPSPSGRV